MRMYFDDRHQPHVHAYYNEFSAIYSLEPPALYQGALPRRQHNLMLGWIELHQAELLSNWKNARNGEPLTQVEGL